MIKFRNLTKDEVEVRVGGGNSLLLYKTARVDAEVLDETVGQENWQKKFYQVKNTMICSIGININYADPNKEPLWIWKDDGGDDDYTMEKVKAEISDATKRAGFVWGIGRSLYYAPKMKLPDEYKGKQFFDVSELEYDSNNRISKITITTDFGKTIVYQYANGRKVNTPSNNTTPNSNVSKNAVSGENKAYSKEQLTKAHENISLWFMQTTPESFAQYLERRFNKSKVDDLTDEEIIKLGASCENALKVIK